MKLPESVNLSNVSCSPEL